MSAYLNYISYYLPSTVCTNQDISKQHPEWSVQKISQKIGIECRHVAGKEETAGDMAFNAAENLFTENNFNKNEIDFVILCTQSPDYFLPSTACILQNRLGLSKSCGAFDINLGCSGYEYGLGIAKGLLETKQANNILLLTAETYTKYISDKDKGNKAIFGDAATATLISGYTRENGLNYEIGNFSYGTDGSGSESLIVRNGASRHKATDGQDNYDSDGKFIRNDNELFMDGKAIFNFTAFEVPKLVKENLSVNSLKNEDIDLFVFHQANTYMLDTVRKRCHIDQEKFYVDINDVGNTVSNSIPIALFKAKNAGKLQGAKYIMLVGFGVGLSMAAVTLTKK